MGTQARGPRLMSGVRKYGRYESFEQFDHLSSRGHASIGSKSIGTINIDCQLLFNQSQWGVLGDDKFPAGIMYLNLNFGPPQGCRVKSATVTITLDEEATCLERYRNGRIFHESGCPVHMADLYGPRGLAGQKKTAYISRTFKATPEANVLGNGGGGVGFDSKKTFTHSCRWSFNGQLLRGPGKRNRALYKSLRWDLNENELESQSFHSNKVQTAFTFEHSGQPFLLHVDIDGKLEKWNDKIKSKLKFGTTLEKQGKVVTLVDFEDYAKFTQPLDPIAESLARVMEMRNFEDIPVEMPDSISGTIFQEAQAQALPHSDGSEQNPTLISSSTPPQSLISQPGGPQLLMAENPFLSQDTGMPVASQAANRVQEFMKALNELEDPETYRIIPENSLSSTASPIIVGSEEDALDAKTAAETKLRPTKRSKKLMIKRGVDEEALSRVLELPLIILILRLLANLMSKLGKGQRALEEPEDAADSLPLNHQQESVLR